MSTLAYALLMTAREEAVRGTSTATPPPGLEDAARTVTAVFASLLLGLSAAFPADKAGRKAPAP